MSHTHNFDEREWPFDQSIDSPTFSTKNVVHNGYPILTIAHDLEGDWQFLCGETDDPDDMSIICFGCMYEKHPFIAKFAHLRPGWIAWRNDESEEWTTEELEEQKEQ